MSSLTFKQKKKIKVLDVLFKNDVYNNNFQLRENLNFIDYSSNTTKMNNKHKENHRKYIE